MTNFWQKLPKPFTVLAPMESVTDFVFREIVANELPKPDVLFTEFTNVDALNSDGFKETISRFKLSKKQKPAVAQIWGTNPENFYTSARMAKKAGFDGIDINMGCPDRAVTKNGSGAALINNPDLAKEIIAAVKKGANGLPISVKTRLGFKTVVTEEWISFLLEQKIDAISTHARTAKQLSRGEANWDEIGKIVRLKNTIAPETIIIGNGDITSYSQVQEMYERYGVDGVMIGRGIFKNPWVFSPDSTRHPSKDYIKVLLKHMNLYEKTWGETKSPEPMKKFYKMYVNNFKGANQLRQQLMETKSFTEARKILAKYN